MTDTVIDNPTYMDPVHGHQDDGVAAELALVSELVWRG
jgi:hypothetical protein